MDEKESFAGDFLTKKRSDEAVIKEEDFQQFLQKQTKRVKTRDIELIKKTFIDEQEIAEEPEKEEKEEEASQPGKYTFRPPGWGSGKDNSFLLDYIVQRKWLEKRDIFEDSRWKKVDEEDNWFHDAAEKKETQFNLRFETGQKEGNKPVARDIETQREVTQSRRKTGRELKVQKREEERLRIGREKELLQELRREKMRSKVEKLIKESGGKDPGNGVIEQLLTNAMKRPEDEALDYLMEKIFNDGYFEKTETGGDDEMLKYLKDVEEDFDESEDEEEVELNERELGRIEEEIGREIDVEDEAPQTSTQIWWYCDICKRGIHPGKLKYECSTCPDFTCCQKCERQAKHPHELKKSKVPPKSVPPPDDQILKLLDLQKMCCDCNEKVFIEIGYHVYREDSNEYYYCAECHKNYEQEEHNFEYVSLANEAEKKANHEVREQLKDILEEGTKTEEATGFEYIDVQADDFGLTDAELVYADERILNQMISSKRMVTYKDMDLTARDKIRMRKMKNLVRKSAEINRKLTQRLGQLNEEERALRLFSSKSHKSRKEYERFVESKPAKVKKLEHRAEMDQDRICVMLGMKLKQKVESEITGKIEKVLSDPNLKVSAKRLSYYNLK